jgi:hypothetical protein
MEFAHALENGQARTPGRSTRGTMDLPQQASPV